MANLKSKTASSPAAQTGTKRAAEAGESPNAKRGKKEDGQISIEESFGTNGTGNSNSNGTDNGNGDISKEDQKAIDAALEDDSVVGQEIEGDDDDGVRKETEKNGSGLKNGEKNAFDEIKADTDDVKKAAQEEQEAKTEKIAENNESVVEDAEREAEIPSSILEKGIIYFFFKARVSVDDPQGVEDIARSYIVLRPLPLGAKLGDGTLPDDGNARLLALPKKVLPQSKQDRFLMFVDKPKAGIKDLRDLLSSNEYATKTVGTSQQPAATPVAEGIYAITSTGRESHLAYHVTYPEIGEIQKELGINEKGSYVVSVKNPKAPGPANASLDNPAEYPEELQKKFRNLRWMPLEPALLDYEHTQFLIIGEGLGNFGNAMAEASKDQKDDEKEKPEEELEKMEKEDHDRVNHLKGDDPVFADLGLSSKEYPKMQTTW